MYISLMAMSVTLQIVLPVVLLTGLAVVFAVLIAVCSEKFAVKRDERIDEVTSLLAGANCGGCGYAGCDAFAEALVKGEAEVGNCGPTSKENKAKIAEILGTSPEEIIVINACKGGAKCREKYDYQGYGDCASAELLAGGTKACPTGCMGLGKCVSECPQNAIIIVEGVAVVDQSKCVQCSRCIRFCPKQTLKRLPKNAVYYVACSNPGRGKEVREVCSAGCIGCGLCAKNCPSGAITMQSNLPVFDYTKCTVCGICAAKCPSQCILKVGSDRN